MGTLYGRYFLAQPSSPTPSLLDPGSTLHLTFRVLLLWSLPAPARTRAAAPLHLQAPASLFHLQVPDSTPLLLVSGTLNQLRGRSLLQDSLPLPFLPSRKLRPILQSQLKRPQSRQALWIPIPASLCLALLASCTRLCSPPVTCE